GRLHRVTLLEAPPRVKAAIQLDNLSAAAASAAGPSRASAAGPSARTSISGTAGWRPCGCAGRRVSWEAIARLADWRPKRPTHAVDLQCPVAAVEVDTPAFDIGRL